MITTIYINKDSYVYKLLPNDNYGSAITLGVSHAFDWTHCRIAFLGFPTNAIPSNAIITSAIFRFYIDSWLLVPKTNDLKRVSATWAEGNITYNNKPALGSAFANFVSNTIGWKEVNITSAFTNWWNGSWANYGLAILMRETLTDVDFYIRSREYTGTTSDPRVIVTYTVPPPLPKIGVGVGNPIIL